MMKKISILVTIILSIVITASAQKSFHDFTVKTLTGEEYKLSDLKGKKVLVVNTASKCGFTPQYKGLESLYKKYKDQNFVVIGFPANNFKNQEPGTNEEIADFCEVNYGVTFPMMEKISVKGEDQHPLYKWLANKSENGKMDTEVGWNFHKYLIDENGQLVATYPSKVEPESSEITNWIEGKEMTGTL